MATKEQLAAMLNGREHGSEMGESDERAAKDSGLVVVFGASDDLVEFRGCIYDEAGVYNGGVVPLVDGRMLENHDDCDCEFCGYMAIRVRAVMVKAEWDTNGRSWTMSTTIPHSTFLVMEDGEEYCQGIVFDYADVGGKQPA